MAMTEERLGEILRQKFIFSTKYVENSAGNKYPPEVNMTIEAFKIISKTEIGSKLLESLDSNTKVAIIPLKNGGNTLGASNDYHQILLYDIGKENSPAHDVLGIASTLLHELEHEKQKQEGLSAPFCDNDRNAFILDKMMEADAKLKQVIFIQELKDMAIREGNNNLLKDINNLHPDIVKYANIRQRYERVSEKVANDMVLRHLFQNEGWNDHYNNQATNNSDFKNYSDSMRKYRIEQKLINDMTDDEKFAKMKELINTVNDGIFFNPQSRLYNKIDRFANTERTETIVITDENDESIEKLCVLSNVKEIKFKEGTNALLGGTTDLPEILDVSMYDEVYLHGADVSNIKELKFKNQEAMLLSLAKIPNDWSGKIICAEEDKILSAREYNELINIDKKDKAIKERTETIVITDENDEKKTSEERILDAMLDAVKFEGEEGAKKEDELIRMATFIAGIRLLSEKNGIKHTKTYAEQFIDLVKESKVFSPTEIDIMLDAGIEEAKIELGIEDKKITTEKKD